MSAPEFGADFRARFADLVAWRRDVRRFRPDPVPEEALRESLALACLSPSVGNSQPWRFVRVSNPERRAAVAASFTRCNDAAAASYDDARASAYRSLKLAGLREAPVHLAVFCDEATGAGHGLGRATMPEMLRYSAVTAVHTSGSRRAATASASAGSRSCAPRRSPPSSTWRRPGGSSLICASATRWRSMPTRNWCGTAGRSGRRRER